jgi:filamentous hemagglutinin
MNLGATLAGAAAGALIDGTQGAAIAATAASEGVKNNFLRHEEALLLIALKEQKRQGQCDGACQQQIDELTKIDQERNARIDACHGVSSAECNAVRQEVRDAAAEYIRKEMLAWDIEYLDIEDIYRGEKSETTGYARDTMDGKALGTVSGMKDFVVDTAQGLFGLAGNLWNTATGDEQARQALMAGANVAWDYVRNPDNWPYLLGALTPEQREELAQAYERGDGYAVGQIMGNQTLNILSNFPSGGMAGTIKIVKAVDKVEDVATVVANTARIVNPNKLEHVFGNVSHNLNDLVKASGGSQVNAFNAVQDAANAAFREGRLTVGPNGMLPGGQAGMVLNVNGVNVQLVGGRIINGEVQIGSFSRRFLNE